MRNNQCMADDIRFLKNGRNFQHKRNSLGEIVQGKDDVKQCVVTITTTQKGSVPFMHNLGCDLLPAIGEKSETAIDYLIGVYSKEVPIQEPRCNIVEVTGEANENGQITMKIYFAQNNETDYVEVYV